MRLWLCTLLAHWTAAQPPGQGGSSSGGTQCADDGADYSWSDVVFDATRTIDTNHCPNHATAEMNPNYAVNSARTYKIPAVPEYSPSQETSLSAQGGIVGVTFDAAMMCVQQ